MNLQQAIMNKTREVLKESQELQITFKTNLREKVTRQARYVDPSISEEQIKEICVDPEVLEFGSINSEEGLEERGQAFTGEDVRDGKHTVAKCCF